MLVLTQSATQISRARVCSCHGPRTHEYSDKTDLSRLNCSQNSSSHRRSSRSRSFRYPVSYSSLTHVFCRRGHESYSSVRRSVIARGFLTQLFGNTPQYSVRLQRGIAVCSKSTEVGLPDQETNDTEASAFDSMEDGGELVLTETTREDGSVASIVYRLGGVIDAAEVDVLCAKVRWPRRQIHKVATALRKSYLVCHIHLRVEYPDGREPEETLIGMSRATSDHAFNATIWDVIVDPEYQGKGLGKCLVEQMVRALLRRNITTISLFAESHVVRFYEQMGFEADPDGIKGMFWCPPT